MKHKLQLKFIAFTVFAHFFFNLNAQDTVGWKKEISGLTPAIKDIAVIDYSIVDKNNIWGLLGVPDRVNGELALVSANIFMRTLDAGKTWEGGQIPIRAGYTTVKIHAVSRDTIWVLATDLGFTDSARLYFSFDGGFNWEEKTSAACEGQGVLVHFFSATEGIVVSSKEVKKTTNGGKTWSFKTRLPVKFDGVDEAYAINAREVNKNNIWIGGFTGYVYYSNDKGNTWKISETPLNAIRGSASSYRVISLAFEDELNGLALGATFQQGGGTAGAWTDFGNCFYTTDGGKTWKDKYFGSGLPYNEIPKTDLTAVPGKKQTYILCSNYTGGWGGAYSAITWNRFDNFQGIDTQAHFCTVFKDSMLGYSGLYINKANEGISRWAPYYLNSSMSVKSPSKYPVQLFPNPANGYFYAKSKSEINTLNIYNVEGKLCYNKNGLAATSIKADIAGLKSGIYYVEIITKSGNSKQKLLIH